MKMRVVLTVFLLATIASFACGGGEEKESTTMRQSQTQIRQGGAAAEEMWEQLPTFPGASSTRARMMPGNQQYAKFEIRVFETQDNAKNVLEFYKKGIPGEVWTFAEQTKLDNGLQGTWNDKTNRATLWVRATENKTTGGTEIEIIYGNKK